MLFTCCNQRLLCSCILSKTGVTFSSFAVSVFVCLFVCLIICPSYRTVFVIYFISAAVGSSPSGSFCCETCQQSESPLSALAAEGRLSSAVGLLLPSACGQTCFGVAFPALLMTQICRCDSVGTDSLWEQGVPLEGEGDCWLGDAIQYCASLQVSPSKHSNKTVSFML